MLAPLAVLTGMHAAVDQLEQALAVQFDEHPLAPVLRSAPGLGPLLGARVLAEVGDDPARFASCLWMRWRWRCGPVRADQDVTGLVHHSDAGQYTLIRYSNRLHEANAVTSIGTVGDSYDNAQAKSLIGLYNTECVKHEGPRRGADHLERATLSWVHWFNHACLHQRLDYRTPAEVKVEHYRHPASLQQPLPENPAPTESGAVHSRTGPHEIASIKVRVQPVRLRASSPGLALSDLSMQRRSACWAAPGGSSWLGGQTPAPMWRPAAGTVNGAGGWRDASGSGRSRGGARRGRCEQVRARCLRAALA